ncbi:MAG: hypothetical protein K0R57_2662 [Paenibacillaceae bacterium]|jgi:hypothetical protein|nr:hypothetical protein [Paenibacillaceae bacterium]
MSLYTEQIAAEWINDRLDLYNLAVSLGDLPWQQQILASLRDKDELIRQEIDRVVRRSLWERFDQINSRLVSIYQQIRGMNSSEESLQLREKAWELKQERVLVGKKLRRQGK